MLEKFKQSVWKWFGWTLGILIYIFAVIYLFNIIGKQLDIFHTIYPGVIMNLTIFK